MKLAKATIGIMVRRKVRTISSRFGNSSRTFERTSRGGMMKTVTIEVRSPDDAMDEVIRVLESDIPAQSAVFTFPSVIALQQVLTEERKQLLTCLSCHSSTTVTQLATLLGRDVRTVYADIEALLDAGVVDRKAGGEISFPYDEIIYPALDSGEKSRSH
jgi:predicted transcriptional regulator